MRKVLFAAWLLCFAGFAAAQDAFPSRTLTIVVPTGPSGQTDVFARLIAEQLRQRLNQPVVVENRPGAGGSLAGRYLASLAMHHYTHFFMHGTSHWLGLDVHDRGSYRIDGASRPLEPGMSFTVEPGLYVGPDKREIELTLLEYDTEERNERRIRLGSSAAAAAAAEEQENAERITHQVPEELIGIGIRIEDDILITQDGQENMTTGAPREIDEVEAMCAERSALPAP
jgi:hypothetical protein